MSWYDRFARVYDGSVERVYAPYRERIVAAAGLKEGGVVLDLPTGTGPNLPWLAAAVGGAGTIVAVDLSAGMLARARARSLPEPAPAVRFLEADAVALDAAQLAAVGVGGLDAVVVTLGLTVFPAWEQVFEATFALLRPGGSYVIFDIYQDRWVPQSALVRWIAQADMSREVWRPLEAASQGFSLSWLPGSRHVHGGRPLLAVGRAPGGA